MLQFNLHSLLLGDVGDEPFQGKYLAVWTKDAPPLLPDPFFYPGSSADAVHELERPFFPQSGLHVVPGALPVIRMDQLRVTDRPVLYQTGLLVTGQLDATFADEFHGPVLVVATAVRHAGEVAHECREGALAFSQRFFHPIPLGDVESNAGDVCRLAVGAGEGELVDDGMMVDSVGLAQDLGGLDGHAFS